MNTEKSTALGSNGTAASALCRPTPWWKSQQTVASIAQELETNPLAWAEFDKWCREGGI